MQVMVAMHVFRLPLIPDNRYKVLTVYSGGLPPLPVYPPYGGKKENQTHACSLGCYICPFLRPFFFSSLVSRKHETAPFVRSLMPCEAAGNRTPTPCAVGEEVITSSGYVTLAKEKRNLSVRGAVPRRLGNPTLFQKI